MNEKLKEFWARLKALNFQNVLEFSKEHQDVIFLVLILGVALALRLWQISSIPAGFSVKEADVINQINSLNLGNLWLGGKFYQGAYVYLGYLAVIIFGKKIIILRMLSALIGALTVLLSYIFISKWFSKKVALFCAFLFAISSFHITLSRLIFPEILLPLVLLTLFVLLTDAYRTKNIWLFGIAGFVGGVGLYTSPSFIMIPVLIILSGLFFYVKNKKFITAYTHELTIGTLGFLAAAIPFTVSFIYHPMSYLTYFGFNRSFIQILMNIGQIPSLLFTRTDINYFANVGAEPLLDPFIFITALFGLIYAVWNVTRRKYFFLVIWMCLFFIYASLKRGVQIVDLVGILPVFYAFSALILDFVIEKWFTTFPLNKKARLLAIGVISLFFALSALYNYDRYFVAYKYSNDVKKEFSATPPTPFK